MQNEMSVEANKGFKLILLYLLSEKAMPLACF